MTYRVLDLFSGIGGFSLGLERTGGFKTVAFCEIDPFCRRVLAKHWPEVPCYHDVRELTAERLAADGIAVGVICGGFPCQDISVAGKGGGLDGKRSGLWSEIARLVGEIRPQFLIVENVSALLGRGLDRVLGDLAALGFDAEWHCIPASALGAPHRRDRFWLVAHPNRDGRRGFVQERRPLRGDTDVARHGKGWTLADTIDARSPRAGRNAQYQGEVIQPSNCRSKKGRLDVADTKCSGLERYDAEIVIGGIGERISNDLRQGCSSLADAPRGGRCDVRGIRPQGNASWNRPRNWPWRSEPDVGRVAHGVPSRLHEGGLNDETWRSGSSHWAEEPPDVPRVAHGVKDRVHRLRALGNAVVPQIPELIGRAILAAEQERNAA